MMSTMRFVSRRSGLVVAALAGLLVGQLFRARVATADSPGTFAPGETLSSNKMNANFATLEKRIAAMEGAASARGEVIPPGTIVAFAGAVAAPGYLLCDGSAKSRNDYRELYALVATTYGAGDGTTTFNLPDLRGRAVIGVDGSAGRVKANNALGNSGGEEKHLLTVAEMPGHQHGHSHTHAIDVEQAVSRPSFPAVDAPGGGGYASAYFSYGGAWSTLDANPAVTQPTGGDAAHNTMPPYQVVNYVIKCGASEACP